MPYGQLFNALNGLEVPEVILNEVRRAFEQYPDFAQHITFPRVSWKWRLEMEVYPREPALIRIESEGQSGLAEFAPEPGEKARRICFVGEREVTAPDQVRDEEGLAVSQPRRTPLGIVDEAVVREAPEDGEPWPQP
jgi:hypothetical protein